MRQVSYEDSIALLKTVFGDGIMTDSAKAKEARKGKPLDDMNGAWRAGPPVVYPNLDLQEPRLKLLMRELAGQLYGHCSNSAGQEVAEKLKAAYPREKDLQHALIGDWPGFSCDVLQQLADDGITMPPRFEKTVSAIMDRYLDHEEDWITTRDHVVAKANKLLLDITPENSLHPCSFSVTDNILRNGEPSGFSLALIFGELPGNDRVYNIPSFAAYDAAIKARGLENVFTFHSHHPTNGDYKELMILNSRSNEHLLMLLEKLQNDTELRLNAGSLLMEFIGDSSATQVDTVFPPQFIAEAEARYPFVQVTSEEERTHNRAQLDARSAYYGMMMQTPLGKAWEEVRAATTAKRDVCIREAWKILRKPTDELREASTIMREQITDRFPLLRSLRDNPYPEPTEATPIRREQPVQSWQAKAARYG